jgi:hypothetical protein
VIDSGEGIARDFLPQVFDRFVQGDVSSTRSHGGLGLGLGIVRDLVRLHGGSVQADSEGPGRGATFIVELPLIGMRASRRPDGDREEETDPRGHDALGFAAVPAGAERREFEAGGRVPAVAVTAMATQSDRRRAIAAGFQLHVAKPAPVALLCDAVRRAQGLRVPPAAPSLSPRS